MTSEFSRQFFGKLTKILRVGVNLFHADGQTGMTKLIISFCNFANAPKNYENRCAVTAIHSKYKLICTDWENITSNFPTKVTVENLRYNKNTYSFTWRADRRVYRKTSFIKFAKISPKNVRLRGVGPSFIAWCSMSLIVTVQLFCWTAVVILL
jgi:hypothetical protein